MTAERRRSLGLGPLSPGTLGRRLVLRVVGIVAATSTALTATSLLALRSAMQDQLDEQVITLATQEWEHATRGRGPATASSGDIVVILGDSTWATVVDPQGATRELPSAARDQLLAVPRDGVVHTVSVPGLGTYRVWADDQPPQEDTDEGGPQGREPQALVVGSSTSRNASFLGTIALVMAALALIAVGVAIAVVHSLIRSSMRPLATLADRADRVSAMNLSKGDVELDAGVEPDPEVSTTEILRVDAAIQRMLSHVSDALTARQASETKVRQFVADASHELRNPLAAIRGYAEITRRERPHLPPDVAFALERIDAESARMNRLVEDLLTLARLDSDPHLSLEPTDLSGIAIDAISDARAAGPEHTWRLELPTAPVVALVDRHRILQVASNLLTNARVHTPAGTHVTAVVRADGEHGVLELHNDGPAIPADKQEMIFERFARLDPSRRRQGAGSTGLGLAIVRSVVEAHDGEISLSSREGSTVFTVRLPLAGPQAAGDTDAPEAQNP